MASAQTLFVFNAILLSVVSAFALGSSLNGAVFNFADAADAKYVEDSVKMDLSYSPMVYTALLVVLVAVNGALLANGAGSGWSPEVMTFAAVVLCLIFLLLFITASMVNALMGISAAKPDPKVTREGLQASAVLRVAASCALAACSVVFLVKSKA
jgi:hypothetical protein